MKNEYKTLSLFLLISWLMGVISVYFLSEGSIINLHYDLHGNVNYSTSSPYALLLIPAVISFVVAFLHVKISKEPKKQNLVHSKKALKRSITAILIILVCVQSIMIAQAYQWMTVEPRWFLTMAGLLFILIGNYLPKTKPNSAIGIRMPWTLSSENTWHKTHRFSGPLFMVSGLTATVISVLDVPNSKLIGTIILLTTPLICLVYSLIVRERFES